jgi:site-specific DNA-methyltransferase (adenine-specific)
MGARRVTEPRIYYADDRCTLIHGRWQDALAAGLIPRVDAVISDPPYSDRTHAGHDAGANLAGRGAFVRSNGGYDIARPRAELAYHSYQPEDVAELVTAMRGICGGWIACLSDSELCSVYRAELEAAGLTGFQPVPCVISGMTVRMCGDGPSSWAVYLNVARPRELRKWGTLRGAYVGAQADRVGVTGGKPVWLMRGIVADYTRAAAPPA